MRCVNSGHLKRTGSGRSSNFFPALQMTHHKLLDTRHIHVACFFTSKRSTDTMCPLEILASHHFFAE